MIPQPHQAEAIEPITAALDDATHAERIEWLRKLGKRDMTALWRLAEGRPVRLDELHGKEGEVVVHEGQNSLPAFNVFQKRVVRRGDVVQGYNEQGMRWLTGPGHFTLQADEGGAYFDYLTHPESVPGEFPALKRNDSGLSRLVYAGMIDRLRRVSRHVVVGLGEKGGKATGDYFVLVRP